MTGSILPSTTDSSNTSLNSHPVHRATSLLQQALLGVASSKSRTTGPKSLVLNLTKPPKALTGGRRVTTIFETGENLAPIQFVDEALEDALTLIQTPVRKQARLRPPQALPVKQDREAQDNIRVCPPQSQLRSLVQTFHDSQRQASLIVAISVAAATVLTVCGMILLFAAMTPGNAEPDRVASRDTIPAATTVPVDVTAAARTPTSRANSQERLVLVIPGRPVALGPLIPAGGARYVLLRGLPENATLSAGRRTGPSAWMVKAKNLAGLTMTLGGGTAQDHQVEVYSLDSKKGPEAPSRLRLRIDESHAGIGNRHDLSAKPRSGT